MLKWFQVQALLVCAASFGLAANPAAERMFRAAERAAMAGDSFQALLLYGQAQLLDPANPLYAARVRGMQDLPAFHREIQLGNDVLRSPSGGSGVPAEPVHPSDLLQAGAEPPPRLMGTTGKHSFHIRGDSRTAIEQVAAAYGIGVVFDSAYQPVPNIRFEIHEAGYLDALRVLEHATDSFLVPVNEKSALVVRDTAQNRAQFTPAMSVAVPIPGVLSTQDAQEIATAVQQVMEIRRISVDPAKRIIFFRDSVTKATAAKQLFNDLAKQRAQVVVDVEFLSVNKTSALSYGLSLPTSAEIVDFGKSIGGFVTSPVSNTGLTNFLLFGGGATTMGLGIGNAAIFGALGRASGRTILESQISSLDGQAATLHIGDRYPVITGAFSGLTPDTVVSSTLAPTINYVDLGLVLKMTPTVHEGNEITLDLDAEFKTLGATAANGIPAIGNRQYQGKVRLKQGEWAVVAGLLSFTTTEVLSGTPGLASIPGLSKIFSKNTLQTENVEVMLILKPHLTTDAPWDYIARPLWTGPEGRPLTVF